MSVNTYKMLTWMPDEIPSNMPDGGMQTLQNVLPMENQHLLVPQPSTTAITTTSSNPVKFEEFEAVSTSGISWAYRFNTGAPIRSIAYGLGITVVGSTNYYYSYDNITWQNAGTGNSGLYQISYGNNLFISVHSTGHAFTSTNGIAWTDRGLIAGSAIDLWSVAYGNGVYVIVANNGHVYTSTTGASWTDRGDISGSSPLYTVMYGNGLFVIGADNGHIYTSSNGTSWTDQGDKTSSVIIQSSVYGGGLYVIGSADHIWTSTNGTAWTDRGDIGTNIWSLTYGNGSFLAGQNNGVVKSSSDTVTWTSNGIIATGNVYALTFGNGVFILGDYSTGKIYTSPANIIQKQYRTFLTDINGVYYKDLSNNTYTMYSWTSQLSSDMPTPKLVQSGNSVIIVAKGNNPQIIRNIFDITPSVVSITRSTTTATVTVSGCTTDLWKVGDTFIIAGCDQTNYNGTFTIATIPSTTTFTYTVTNTGASPATGTITCQFTATPILGSPPQASYATVNNSILLLANTDNTNGAIEVFGSRRGNFDDWTPAVYPGPASYSLTSAIGEITGINSFGNTVIVNHSESVTVMTFSWGPDTYTRQENKFDKGAIPSSIIAGEDVVYWYDESHFYKTDGNSIVTIEDSCYNQIFSEVSKSGFRNIPVWVPAGTYNKIKDDLIIWSFTPTNPFSYQQTFLVYNTKTGQFAKLSLSDTNIYALGTMHNAAGTQNYLAAAVWTSAEIGATSALVLKYLDGTAYAVTLKLGSLYGDGQRFDISNIRPRLYNIDETAVTASCVGFEKENSTSGNTPVTGTMNAQGNIPLLVSGNAIDVQIAIAAGQPNSGKIIPKINIESTLVGAS